MDLAEVLRSELEARGLSVTDFVRAAMRSEHDTSDRSLWRAVTGESLRPQVGTRRAIEAAFGWPEGAVQRIIEGQPVEQATAVGGRATLEQRVHLLETKVEMLLEERRFRANG